MTWQTDTLAALGAPSTPTTREVLTEWALSENTPASINNPLACGTPWGGSTAYNATGVQRYKSIATAVAAYAFSLTHSPYSAIGQALRAGTGPLALWKLINASPWCSGCHTGHYPEVLWTTVGRPTQATKTPPKTPKPPGTPTPKPPAGPQADLTEKWARVQDDAGSHAATLRRRIVALGAAIRRG